jgi:hypothetical protein
MTTFSPIQSALIVHEVLEDTISFALKRVRWNSFKSSDDEEDFKPKFYSSEDEGIGLSASLSTSPVEELCIGAKPLVPAVAKVETRADGGKKEAFKAALDSFGFGQAMGVAHRNKVWSSDTWDWTESAFLTSLPTPSDTTIGLNTKIDDRSTSYGAIGTQLVVKTKIHDSPDSYTNYGAVGTDPAAHTFTSAARDVDVYSEGDSYGPAFWTARGLIDLDKISPCTHRDPCILDKFILTERAKNAQLQASLMYEQLNKIVDITANVIGEFTKSSF